MPSLVSSTEISSFTGDFQDLFDTFKRLITVHKTPKRIIKQINTDFLHGYGEPADQVNYTYSPVSQDFDCMVLYKDRQDAGEISETNLTYFAGDVRIKVDQDTRDYIKDGKTEKIVIDGKDFQLMTEESVKYFFGIKLFVFHLQFTS
tara:strand:- start:1086 stop:1526 length:441 start_codon:yes stop_codon:yes gene_type:complete